jgi:fused signal recognition particle receptor
MSWIKNSFQNLKNGLTKTRQTIFNKIEETFTGKSKLDESDFDKLEEILINSDLGTELSLALIENTRKSLHNEDDRTFANIIEILKNELIKILGDYDQNSNSVSFDKNSPYIILVVGVNGTGKTTTIGKLANFYKNEMKSVLLVPCDTFRAAANEQLNEWALRSGVEIWNNSTSKDPSSVAFDSIKHALNEKIDIVLIDTAGRLHNNANLMIELSKINRVISNLIVAAPNETLLVVDGNSGQNALRQADEFLKYVKVTGLIVTKLDGTAKGGSVIQISHKKRIPIKFIGTGEKINDLQEFNQTDFVNALFEKV